MMHPEQIYRVGQDRTAELRGGRARDAAASADGRRPVRSWRQTTASLLRRLAAWLDPARPGRPSNGHGPPPVAPAFAQEESTS